MWAVLRLQRLRMWLFVREPPSGGNFVTVVRRARTEPGPRVELLWFQDCPNYGAVRAMLGDLLTELAPTTTVEDIDATDPAVAERHEFPGSPTIRVDGRDVDPSFQDPGDYTALPPLRDR